LTQPQDDVDGVAIRKGAVGSISVNNAGGTIYVFKNPRYSFASFSNLRRRALEPLQADSGIHCGRSHRLRDLVTTIEFLALCCRQAAVAPAGVTLTLCLPVPDRRPKPRSPAGHGVRQRR